MGPGVRRGIALAAGTAAFFVIAAGALFYYGILWFVYPKSLGYDVKGIDVSMYQGEIDWSAMASQEITFAFVKATEGSGWTDPMFCANIVLSREHGVYAGAYHYFSAESPGETQAENFVRTVSPYQMDLPPVLDFEVPAGAAAEKAALVKEVRAFLKEVEERFGVKPVIYTTCESYDAFLAQDFGGYSLWIRDLFREPKAAGGRDWLFWQYCSRGRVAGTGGPQKYTDLDVFHGSLGEFEAYVRELSTQMETARMGA